MVAHENDFLNYIKIFKRRKIYFFLPAIALILLSTAVIFTLPAIYQSRATILIEEQEVPQELVRSTVTGYIEERLKSLSQVVFKRSNLLALIDRFHLYVDLKEKLTTEEIIEKMRKDIEVESIQANVATKSGAATVATIAFSLSFEGKNPDRVLQTTNALVSLFLEENLRTREEKALTTSTFLGKQLSVLREDVVEFEDSIAEFKENNYRALPEFVELNMMTLERVEKDIERRQASIQMLTDRKAYLGGQLATLEPIRSTFSMDGTTVMAPEDELKALHSQFLQLKSTYSKVHPDVIRLQGLINMLEEDVKTRNEMRSVRMELSNARDQVSILEQRYTDKHPDLTRARVQVVELEKEMQRLGTESGVMNPDIEFAPDNPAYINLRTQIEATVLEIASEHSAIADLRLKAEDYLTNVAVAPRVEQEYRILLRDYENSNAKYQETLQKFLAARQAHELEKEHLAERFSLVEPPVYPEKPHKPKRYILLVVAIILSLGAGLGLVAMREMIDNSFYGRSGLAKVVSTVPIMGVIPYVETRMERRLRKLKKFTLALILVGLCTGAAAVVHFFFIPLDILMIMITAKLRVVL